MQASEEAIAYDLKSFKEVHRDYEGEVRGQSLLVGGE